MISEAENSRSGMSAEEFAAQLAANEEYQRAVADFDAHLDERAAEWRAAERPLVAELNAAGVIVESVWDLVSTETPYPAALPILVRYLEDGDLPDRVIEGVGRSLAVKPSIKFWDRLVGVLRAPSTDGQLEGTAVALAACATTQNIGDLIHIVKETERIPQHVYLLRPIWELGGEPGKELVTSLREDSVLAPEAVAITDGVP